MTFASKDIFDVVGKVTGGGNPAWTATHTPAEANAWVVQQLLAAGAELAGKTITDELTRGYFRRKRPLRHTDKSPAHRARVPGGSSSAVGRRRWPENWWTLPWVPIPAGRWRVPASFCGLYGLRPTHGRIPRGGMLLQAPSYDTIGWFARDPDTFQRVGRVLLASDAEPALPTHLIIAEDAFELAEPETRAALTAAVEGLESMFQAVTTERLSATSLTDWSNQQQILQSRGSLGSGAGVDRPGQPGLQFRGVRPLRYGPFRNGRTGCLGPA